MDNRIDSFRLDECVSTAWQKVYGAKGSIWGAIGISILVAFFFGILTAIVGSFSATLAFIVSVAGQIAGFLIQMGIIYIAIMRAKDLPINFKQVFYTFDMNVALRVIGVYILQMLIYLIPGIIFFGLTILVAGGAAVFSTIQAGLGFASFMLISWLLLGVLAFIYITLRMYCALGLALDKNLNPVDAIKQSIALTAGNEFKLLGLIFVQMLSFIVGALLLGIGLIWAIPFALIAYGVAYVRMTSKTPAATIILPGKTE